MSVRLLCAVLGAVLVLALPAPAVADQVIPDDLIVQGNGCVGLACADGESFGNDALRLKNGSLRMNFEDTSTGAFPGNDWRFVFNDLTSGGANYFAVEDATASRTPFKVMAAPTDAMVLSSSGRLGLGTPTPVLDLSIRTANTPAMRLEQTNAGGFTAQTWDMAANEANFFVRDVTGGSRLPFRIRPGAPTSSVDISADGDVGFGLTNPQTSLHVKRDDGSARLEVEEASPTGATRILADLVNNGEPQLRFTNSAAGATSWLAGPSSGAFVLKTTAGGALDALRVDGGGDTTSAGILQQNAAPAAVENAAAVDPKVILSAIRSLPVSRFEYTGDAADAVHLAPSAAEFRAALNVGGSDNALAPADLASAALAGVQALAADGTVGTLETRVAAAENQLTGLAGTVGRVETRMGTAEGQLSGLAGRLGTVETALTGTGAGPAGHAGVMRALNRANTRLSRRVTTLSKRNSRLAKRLRRLERAVKQLG